MNRLKRLILGVRKHTTRVTINSPEGIITKTTKYYYKGSTLIKQTSTFKTTQYED